MHDLMVRSHRIQILLRFSIMLLMLVVVTACPGHGTIKKAIRRSESLQLEERFEKLFKQSVNIRETALVFSHVDKSPGNTVYFEFNSIGKKHSNWEMDALAFQKKLQETQTAYQSIEIYNGSTFSYTPNSLDYYERSFGLFKENMLQIRDGKIEELYKTMGKTVLQFKQLKELIDFVQIADFNNYEVIVYPPDEMISYRNVTSCLHADAETKLYFSYINSGRSVCLKAIDLNNFATL